MTPHEMSRLEDALKKLALVYKETWENETLKKIYYQVLGDLPLDDVLHACELWLASDTHYFPKPGQLRTLALNLPTNPSAPDNLKTRAEMAWQNLRGLARDRYNRWALEDSITQQVFRLMGGGYTTEGGFGQWDAQYEELKHREFLDAYLALAGRSGTLPPLPMGEPALLPPRPDTRTRYQREEEDHREDITVLLTALQDRLSVPPDNVPAHYLREQPPGNPLQYEPHLTPAEVEVRTRILHRQAQAVMAQDAVRTLHTPPYVPPQEDEYVPEPEEE